MEIHVPTIHTDRLELRPFREDDVEPFFQLSQDSDVMRYIGLIDPENVASIGVATKLGETLRREMQLWGHRVLVYAISREEWQGRAQAGG